MIGLFLGNFLLPLGIPGEGSLPTLHIYPQAFERHGSVNGHRRPAVEDVGHALSNLNDRGDVQKHLKLCVHAGSPNATSHDESAPPPNSLRKHDFRFAVNPRPTGFSLTQISPSPLQVAG